MPRLTWSELQRGAEALDGSTLRTLGQGKPFTVRVLTDGLEFTPHSTGRPRRHPRSVAERVLERYDKDGSLVPGRYKRITAHASYVIALIHALRGVREHPSDSE